METRQTSFRSGQCWRRGGCSGVEVRSRGRNRVSLGMKQLGDDPWTDISRRYPENSRLFGKVTNVTDYGAFVELEEGIEGLVSCLRNGLDQSKCASEQGVPRR